MKCNSFMKRNMFSLKHDLIFIEITKALQSEIHFAEIESCNSKLKFEKVFKNHFNQNFLKNVK